MMSMILQWVLPRSVGLSKGRKSRVKRSHSNSILFLDFVDCSFNDALYSKMRLLEMNGEYAWLNGHLNSSCSWMNQLQTSARVIESMHGVVSALLHELYGPLWSPNGGQYFRHIPLMDLLHGRYCMALIWLKYLMNLSEIRFFPCATPIQGKGQLYSWTTLLSIVQTYPLCFCMMPDA